MKKLLMIILICMPILSHTQQVGGLDSPEGSQPQLAPLNPDFIQYLEDKALGLVELKTSDGFGMGEIPSPLLS